MLEHPRDFFAALFGPPRATGRLPTPVSAQGKPLDAPWRESIEYRLAELGYGLREEIRILALPASVRLPVGLFHFTHDALLVDRRAVADIASARFEEDALLYDLPHVLISRPACSFATDPLPAEIAADSLTLLRLARPEILSQWFSSHETERIADTFICSQPVPRMAAIARCYGVEDARTIASACDIAAHAGRSLDENLPAFRVTPSSLAQYGFTPGAIQRVADRYGWIESSSGWQGGFLPLQIFAITRGVFDAKQKLLQSGIVAAPTSAGKTLIAELRMLGRFLAEDPKRKKTIMLIPTREIGTERWHGFRDAYAASKSGRQPLRVVYSDAEHGGDDGLIREGQFDLAIIINEKFRFFQQFAPFLEGVGEIVLDELGVMGQGPRGLYLEMLFTGANCLSPSTTVLGLTTPARGLEALLEPMQAAGKGAWLLQTTRRPIPIEAGIWSPQTGSAEYLNTNTLERRTVPFRLSYPRSLQAALKELLIEFLEQTPQERQRGHRNNLVIAVPTKRDSILVAGLLAELYTSNEEVRRILETNRSSDLIEPRLRSLEPTMRRALLARLLPLGVGFHDADLTAAERQTVGDAFRQGEIAVLVCTSAMAKGVNLPAQNIVFLGWSGSGAGEGSEPYYHLLRTELIPWLGRVGRYGRHAGHRPARALYVAAHGPGSGEYETIRNLLEGQQTHFETMLETAASLDEAVLFALSSLRHALDRAPTFSELEAWLHASPGARTDEAKRRLSHRALEALVDLGGFGIKPERAALEKHIADAPDYEGWEDLWCDTFSSRLQALLDVLPETSVKRQVAPTLEITRHTDPKEIAVCADLAAELLKNPGLTAVLLQNPDRAEMGAVEIVVQEGENTFETTRLGQIAGAHGVQIKTCQMLYRWLARQSEPAAWDLLDILVLLRSTPDGAAIRPFPICRSHFDPVDRAYRAHIDEVKRRLGPEWEARSLLLKQGTTGAFWQATLLAMHDWRTGAPIYAEAGRDEGIEQKYGFVSSGCALYESARAFARLLRVLASLAGILPQTAFPLLRPPSLPEGVVVVPYDLEALCEEILYGLPSKATSLARIGVEGLSRAWVMSIWQAVEARRFEPGLPLLERARLFAEDTAAFRAILPTPGLATRIIENLTSKGRLPLADKLRVRPLVEEFYSHPFIAAAHVAQGQGRVTALRVRHQRVYTVFRRNVQKGQPIRIAEAKDVPDWVSSGAVEFLAEIGKVEEEGYTVDSLFVDLDARGGYSLDGLKRLAGEIAKRFAAHDWVDADRVAVHWTGGKGFHIIGYFKEDVFRPVDLVERALKTLLSRLCNDVDIFLADQPGLTTPYVVLDLAPVKERGVYRNAYSLHAGTGNVCIPVELARLKEFDPEKEATLEALLERLNDISGASGQ